MNNLNRKFVIILFSLLFLFKYSYNQQVFKIYNDDSISQYFKELGKNNGYYRSYNNIKDSLPDGIYLFYDVKRKDSLSKTKNIIIKAQYENNCKVGLFEFNGYSYDKNGGSELRNKEQCSYKNGKKDGIEECYNYYPSKPSVSIINFYGEYLEGKKNGLFMYFKLGYPTDIIIYENDSIKKILLKR